MLGSAEVQVDGGLLGICSLQFSSFATSSSSFSLDVHRRHVYTQSLDLPSFLCQRLLDAGREFASPGQSFSHTTLRIPQASGVISGWPSGGSQKA